MPNIEGEGEGPGKIGYDYTKPMVYIDDDGNTRVQIPDYMYYGPPKPAETYDIMDDERFQYGTPVTMDHIINTYKLYNLPESVRYVIAERLMNSITQNITSNINEQPDTNSS